MAKILFKAGLTSLILSSSLSLFGLGCDSGSSKVYSDYKKEAKASGQNIGSDQKEIIEVSETYFKSIREADFETHWKSLSLAYKKRFDVKEAFDIYWRETVTRSNLEDVTKISDVGFIQDAPYWERHRIGDRQDYNGLKMALASGRLSRIFASPFNQKCTFGAQIFLVKEKEKWGVVGWGGNPRDQKEECEKDPKYNVRPPTSVYVPYLPKD